jgi:hypothetical protein
MIGYSEDGNDYFDEIYTYSDFHQLKDEFVKHYNEKHLTPSPNVNPRREESRQGSTKNNYNNNNDDNNNYSNNPLGHTFRYFKDDPDI